MEQQPQPQPSTKRTRNEAGKNEIEDIRAIVSAIHTRSVIGMKLIQMFQEKFSLPILDARERKGNRGVHYDFQILVGPEPGVWKNVEHKGSRHYTPIGPDQTPWAAGVQFHNGGAEKYTITKQYARHWYDLYIGNSAFKTEWGLSSDIPSFEEWFQKDVKAQGDPKTPFGKELKNKVRAARGPKASLLEKRAAVNAVFQPTEEDLATLMKEASTALNDILLQKDYWLTIHGDISGNFYCAWYPSFKLGVIEKITIVKQLDIWFEFTCQDCTFHSILRWGKGAGYSNLRMDARD